jgi:uncharacterized protein YecT (DUF1311 family)
LQNYSKKCPFSMKNLVIVFLMVVVYFQYTLGKEFQEGVSDVFPDEPESGSAADDSAVKKCMDEVDLAAFKNVQRTHCYVKEVARLEAILDRTLKEVIEKSPSNTRQHLQDAEGTWLDARDEWCNYIGSLPMAPLPLFNRQYCLAEQTVLHIERLNMTRDELNDLKYSRHEVLD